jgi:hypothetical protein
MNVLQRCQAAVRGFHPSPARALPLSEADLSWKFALAQLDGLVRRRRRGGGLAVLPVCDVRRVFGISPTGRRP